MMNDERRGPEALEKCADVLMKGENVKNVYNVQNVQNEQLSQRL